MGVSRSVNFQECKFPVLEFTLPDCSTPSTPAGSWKYLVLDFSTRGAGGGGPERTISSNKRLIIIVFIAP